MHGSRKNMEEQRARRLITAGVAAAVAFLVVLLAVLVYQMICINQTKKELDELKRTEQEYLELKDNYENEITLWLEEWKVEEAARKYGFRKNGK